MKVTVSFDKGVLGVSVAMCLVSCAAQHVRADVITAQDAPGWMDDGSRAADWRARPDWLSNPDPCAAVHSDGGSLRFSVGSPGRGMKWSRAFAPLVLAETPYFLLRYRADRIDSRSEDYAVYLDDGVARVQCSPIRLKDLNTEGKWELLCVDVRRITAASTVQGIAVQVQAGSMGKAEVWVDEVGLCPTPPSGARWVGGTSEAPVRPDQSVDLSVLTWQAQPGWLGNPGQPAAAVHDRSRGSTLFRVREGSRGMKWSCGLPNGLDLSQWRYLRVEYAARSIRPHEDYAICLLGVTREGSASGVEEVIRGTDLQADGLRRVLVVRLAEAAARLPKATGLAVQVQADRGPATIEIGSIGLLQVRPPTTLDRMVPVRTGASFTGFAAVDVGEAGNQSLPPVLRALDLSGWPTERQVTVNDIPFELGAGQRHLAATGVVAKGERTLTIGRKVSQVFLLTLGVFRGREEDVYGGGELRRIVGVDRFRCRVEYDDGTIDECLPGSVSTGRWEIVAGPQVLCVNTDSGRVLRSITLCDMTPRAGFVVAAVTARTEGERLFRGLDESSSPPVVKRRMQNPDVGTSACEVTDGAGRLRFRNRLWEVCVDPRPEIGLCSIRDILGGMDVMSTAPSRPFFRLSIDGKPLEPQEIERISSTATEPLVPGRPVEWVYRSKAHVGIEFRVSLDLRGDGALRFRARLVNVGGDVHRVGMGYPRIGPYRLGRDGAESEYVFPGRGFNIGKGDTQLRQRYGGLFPHQFLATVNAAEGMGLHLWTEDTTCIERYYALEKSGSDLTMGVSYPERPIGPGHTRVLADTMLAIGDGDWHTAFDTYRSWLRTWYRPAQPRNPWFREVFNFRQRFLHWLDPLYDAKRGQIGLDRAISEANSAFGGAEYLHLFDWGYCGPFGRIYGRIGDLDPYDYLRGGQRGLADAIAGVRCGGVPVGLYIEGYLLDERGRLGRQYGRAWQVRGADGSWGRWPESTELYVCPGVQAWRDIQAATYARKVQELDVDGMYVDQFGFTGTDKDCYSDGHGHPVPSNPVVTELETLKAIRRSVDAVKPGVAIYTEETPCDVTSQYQDGSFTYALSEHRWRDSQVPLNLYRFALPDFKTFEILICDKPTGSWATGIRWAFFNGEGLWLEGPAEEWFEAQTRAEIRTCHAVLRRHKDAFTSDCPVPLVPVLMGGVCANYFPRQDKEVWTLYNSRHHTVRGEVLRTAHRSGWSWQDAFQDRAASVRTEEGYDVVTTAIGPQGVGCLVRTRAGERSASR